jgi:hypothetical protein
MLVEIARRLSIQESTLAQRQRGMFTLNLQGSISHTNLKQPGS